MAPRHTPALLEITFGLRAMAKRVLIARWFVGTRLAMRRRDSGYHDRSLGQDPTIPKPHYNELEQNYTYACELSRPRLTGIGTMPR